MKQITVILAEDHQIVREGLRSLLKHERDIKVVGEAENGRQALRLARQLNPAVVVMDIAMPLLNGLEATRQIRQTCPGTRVLILSAHNEGAYVEQMTKLGAGGYLLKQTTFQELATAIREVEKGNHFFSPRVSRGQTGGKVNSLNVEDKASTKKNRLSSRESEVLQLIAEGKPNKQIAAELGVSFKTVDKHRQHLMSKLDIHDVAGLTRYAISSGSIESKLRITFT